MKSFFLCVVRNRLLLFLSVFCLLITDLSANPAVIVETGHALSHRVETEANPFHALSQRVESGADTVNINNFKNWRFELAINLSRIIPHRSYFLADVDEFTGILDLDVSHRVSGAKPWHVYYSYPEFGAMLSLAKFGNSDVFGSAIGVLPYLRWNWPKKSKDWSLFLKLGFGLGYVSKGFDEIDNPGNNAISTKLNNYSRLEFGWNKKLRKKTELALAISASHFSNANVSQPNLGLNLISVKAGLRWGAGDEPSVLPSLVIFSPPKWRVFARASWGMTTGDISGANADHVCSFSVYGARSLGQSHIVQLGINYEHLWPIRTFLIEQADENLKQASKVWMHVGYEYLMDQLGLVVQAGVYLYDPVISRPSMANRFGFNFYPTGSYGKKKTFYLGAYLKSHSARADYPEVVLGIGF